MHALVFVFFIYLLYYKIIYFLRQVCGEILKWVASSLKCVLVCFWGMRVEKKC